MITILPIYIIRKLQSFASKNLYETNFRTNVTSKSSSPDRLRDGEDPNVSR